jgi:hypothetical protein
MGGLGHDSTLENSSLHKSALGSLPFHRHFSEDGVADLYPRGIDRPNQIDLDWNTILG